MNIREAFLTAVEYDEPDEFLDYVEKHNSKNDTFDITEVLQTLSKKQKDRLCQGLKELCSSTVLKAAPSIDEEEENEDNEKISRLLLCLEGVTTVATCATAQDKPYIPPSLLETAVILHGIMMTLPDETQKLQNIIAQLCETWFLNDLDGKEELVTNTLPFLVIRTLAKGTACDVKRLWRFRQSLLLLDFEDESSEPLKQLLQQCVIHPIFQRTEEGRRFLSFLFGMHPNFIKDLHKTIKNQIPNCSLEVLSFYGEVYFRAWRVASGQYLEVIEKDCFQDLMYAAVHANRAGVQSMSSRLRKVLSYFHQQKKQQGVDGALVKLYQPILWRAFKVANPMVRANAAAILLDAFPLQNPDASNEQVDELLQKQFDILQDLFEDPSPVVRATGVHGVCRVACVFWELIPVHIIKTLLNKLICEIAFDASSSTVRVAVFQGLKFLLENHLSHPMLKMLLSKLSDAIHDVSEKVRSAFLDLLLLVKGIKAIKFWNIVPLENLLACLEVETSGPVLRKLVKLLMNSFHPVNKDPDVQITRCASLWQANSVAARKFYQYAHLHTAVHTTGRFLLMLCRCLMQWARNVAPSSNESLLPEDIILSGSILDSTENKENEEEGNEDVFTLPDNETISGLLETIAISWTGIKSQLEKKANENIKAKLIQYFSKALPKLLSTVEDARSRAAIIVISAHLPQNCVPSLSKKCLSTLSSLQDSSNSQDFGPMLDCLCSWGQSGKVLETIHTCLLNNLTANPVVKHGKQASKSDKLQPSTAIDFLFWILSQPPCREAVMSHQDKLLSIADTLKNVTNLIESMTVAATNKRSLQQEIKELYPKALKMFCHLHIHLNSKVCKAAEEMTKLLFWTENIILPRLDIYRDDNNSVAENGKRPSEENSKDHFSSKEVLEVILTCCIEFIKLGMDNEEFCCQATALTKSITLLNEKGLPFLPHLSQLMFQMSQRVMFMDLEQNNGHVKDYTQDMLTNILRAISSNRNAENITQVLLKIKSPLAEVLKVYESKKQTVQSLLNEKPQIMASIMAACLAELSQQTLDFGEQPVAADLPRLSSFILGILLKSKVLLRSFVEELHQCITSGAVQDKTLLLSAQFMLAVIVNSNSKVDNLKTCGLYILQQLERLSFDDLNTSNNNHDVNIEQVKKMAKVTMEQLGVVC